MNKEKKFSGIRCASAVIGLIAIVAFFLPINSAIGTFSFDMTHSYNIIDVIQIIFGGKELIADTSTPFYAQLILSCILLVLGFVSVIVLTLLTFLNKNVSVRRVVAVFGLVLVVIGGISYNSSMTNMAKTGNNYFGVYPEFKINQKVKSGSVNNWADKIQLMIDDAETLFTDTTKRTEAVKTLNDLKAKSLSLDYTAKKKDKVAYNEEIFEGIKGLFPFEQQVEVFEKYFSTMTKTVSAISSTYGLGFLAIIVLMIVLCSTNYSERNANGYANNGIRANCMFVGIMGIALACTMLLPMLTVTGGTTEATGLKGVSLLIGLIMLPKLADLKSAFANVGIAVSNAADVDLALVWLSIALMLVAVVCMVVFIIMAAKAIKFKLRRVFAIAAAVTFTLGSFIFNQGFGASGVKLSAVMFLVIGLLIAGALIPFTVYIDKERYKAFSIVNVVLFLIICAFIVVPLWKVFIDSIDMTAGYGMRLWPEKFTLAGYLSIITNPNMSTPLLISVFTTVIGTLLGLILATLGAYVLIQFDMPGRNLLAGMLMFTLIFQAGMIPTYLVMVKLHLYNTLWSVIGILSINVYNLVLMRNFFEGIPKSLFEAASIDGCSPMGIFGRIVLPLSKAALASIGLMYAVAFWNDYTNFKLYISNTNLHNFQMRLRAMIFSSEMPNNTEISSNTLQNAAVMVAILPFMIVYPFCQKYFVKGINIGAVKE